MNLGIIGAGSIAKTLCKTVNMMNDAKIGGVKLYAIASRDIEKSQKFAKDNKVKKAFGSYEEMLNDPEVDAVYIATPHSFHFEQAKMCIEHKKHVLCEKAFTVNAKQAKEICDLAKENGVLIAEAIWTRYQPMRKLINDIVFSGELGEPKMITANLVMNLLHKERLVNPELAGGALLDVGVYALNFAEMIFGHPTKIDAICLKTDRGVDATDIMTLQFENGRYASLIGGMTCKGDRRGVISCERGFIEIENINNPQSITLYDNDYKKMRKLPCPVQYTGYEYEILEFEQTIKEGKLECPSMPHSETIHMMEVMDEVRRQNDIVYPFEK